MTEAANFFDMIAEAQTPAPIRRKEKRAEDRRALKEAAEKELEEQEALLRQYRAWRAERKQALLDGPHGKDVRGIVQFLRTMTLSSAPGLLKLIERSAWIRTMSASDRADLLNIIGSSIVRLRVRSGLPEFDDEIPFAEPPKAFSQIKQMMDVR